jgi:hypothetical protein
MAVKAVCHFHGSNLEVGTFTLDPASIAAAAQGVSTVTVTGAKVGDLVFVNAEALDNRIVCAGAKVTATDTVSLYINNMFDATTAVDGASKTWSYLLFHLS